MNSTCYVAVIAFIIHFFLNNSPIVKKMLKTFLFIAVILFGTVLSNFVQPLFTETGSKEIYTMNKIVWTLYVGSNYSTSAICNQKDMDKFGWNPESDFSDLIKADNSLNTQNDIDSYRERLLFKRYQKLLQNPSHIIELLHQKFKMWSAFYYPFSYYDASRVNGLVNTIFLNITNFEYIGYFLITLIYFINIILKKFYKQKLMKKGSSSLILWIKLFLIGCTLFLLIVECNYKYALVMQPLFICICICDTSIYCYKNSFKKLLKKFSIILNKSS